MTATGNYGYKMADGTVCGKPTNESVRFGTTDFYFCHEHLTAEADKLAGRPFKDSPKPKDESKPKEKPKDELKK